jgi:glycosyltransferase involved in cell wall biosynthesis
MTNKKLFVGITAPNSVDLLIGQLRYFQSKGYIVSLLAPNDRRVIDYCAREGVTHISVRIERNISLWRDVCTLFFLIRLFIQEKPDIINFGTPKMSLLGMVAGFITRVPLRVYTCRGFRFEHENGASKKLLIYTERVTSYCAHRIFCVSKSVRDLGVELGIFPIHKTRLIAMGSSNGIDLNLFNKNNINISILTDLSIKYSLEGTFVIGFVGRLIDRKGLKELYHAFSEIYQNDKNLRLLVIGRPFEDQIKDPSIIDMMNDHPGIIMVGFQPIESIPYYMSLMQLFLFPAHWEGFGNVLIQAAAMGVPILATNVTGCRDAVHDGFNGVLVTPGDHNILVAYLKNLIYDNQLRNTLGDNGIIWSRNFRSEIIWHGYDLLYKNEL